jgi:uncharacterized protein YjbI with pentapeptide repeats
MKDLKELIELHKEWLVDNNSGTRLDLSDANLGYANLSGANLRYANLRYADLRYANLRYADLSGANLGYADLSDANLSDANLGYANLSGADLRYANLRYADLGYADLGYADLSDADLGYANLRYADLRNCIGNNIEIKSLQLGTYLVSYTKEILSIGCQSHSHSKWRTFSDNIILDMDGELALNWWNLNKHIIFELIDREQR